MFMMGAEKTMDVIKKVWREGELMNGGKCGLGFMFLYKLLRGSIKARASTGWSYKRRTRSDSPRLALLLAQLYSDRRQKSVCNSIISILNRNRSACIRMPAFNDTRKNARTPIHNGFQDSAEPQSGLNAHMTQIAQLFQKLHRARGMLSFPPKPPYPELPSTPTAVEVKSTGGGGGGGSPLSSPNNNNNNNNASKRRKRKKKKKKPKNKFQVTDFACDHRALQPVQPDAYRQLFGLLKKEQGSSRGSGDIWQILAPLAGESRLLPKPVTPVRRVASRGVLTGL